MKFSIVIPILDSPIIDRTLSSLHKQSYDLSQVEAIVVGQDGYGLVREDSLVRFERSPEPLAPAAARNRGMKQASGDVIVFIDSDCVADSNWLAVLAQCYQDPIVDVVGGAVGFARDNYWTLSDNVSMFHDYMTDSPAGKRPQLPSLNLSVRRKVVEQVGYFDERYPRPAGEDADWTIRMRQAGYDLYFEPCAVVYHYPPRYRLADLLRHGFYQGKYSAKVNPRRAGTPDSLPALLCWRPLLVLAAPLLAAGVTGSICLQHPRFWYLAPALFLAKIVWCIGAMRRPDWREK